MSLLGNALIGAVGGGAKSYADQIRREAQQAREERLKEEDHARQVERDDNLQRDRLELEGHRSANENASAAYRATLAEESAKRNQEKWVDGEDEIGHYQKSSKSDKKEYIPTRGQSDKLDPRVNAALDMWKEQYKAMEQSRSKAIEMGSSDQASAIQADLNKLGEQITFTLQTGKLEAPGDNRPQLTGDAFEKLMGKLNRLSDEEKAKRIDEARSRYSNFDSLVSQPEDKPAPVNPEEQAVDQGILASIGTKLDASYSQGRGGKPVQGGEDPSLGSLNLMRGKDAFSNNVEVGRYRTQFINSGRTPSQSDILRMIPYLPEMSPEEQEHVLFFVEKYDLKVN